MRFLKAEVGGGFSLTWFEPNQHPPYAILSHRWEAEEVTFQDMKNGSPSSKAGYKKIQFCGDQAKNDGLEYFWVDSCSIDKSSSAELTEAINSMFLLYQKATKCYVYLSDVSINEQVSAFPRSLWFTRGWTLQELLAPSSVEFFSRECVRLGNKQSLEDQIQQITGIPVRGLQGDLRSLLQFSVQERLQWAENRQTTREEDQAYCLMGIFVCTSPCTFAAYI
jgi:hypothetical protein